MNNAPVSMNDFKKLTLNEQIQNMASQNPSVQPKVELEAKPDKVEISAKKQEKPKRKGLLEKISNLVGSIKKFGVRIGGYTAGGLKGAGSFVAGGAATVGSIFTIHKLRQGAKIATEAGTSKLKGAFGNLAQGISNVFKSGNFTKTLKSAKGIGTILAGAAVGSVLFLRQIYKAKLNVNDKTADLNHKYYNNPHTV